MDIELIGSKDSYEVTTEEGDYLLEVVLVEACNQRTATLFDENDTEIPLNTIPVADFLKANYPDIIL